MRTTLRLQKHQLTFTFILISVSLAACSPKFYLNDRQTVLEEEAAGEWPDFEKALLERSKATGPTPFVKTENSTKRNKLYQVLNGEMTNQSKSN
jgi:hypothetical protein